MATPVYVALDSRKPVSLARFAAAAAYVVTAEANGRIILEPAVAMTRSEAALFADPQIRTQYEAVIASRQPLRPRPARRP